jgi:dUTP pyrophosphatase
MIDFFLQLKARIMKYILKIKADNPELADKYRNHTYFHNGDSGIDLFVHSVEDKGDQVIIDFGIQCEMVRQKTILNLFGERWQRVQTSNVSYMLFPRSSIVKTPFRMANSIGLIDAAYRGNIKAVVDNKTPGSLPQVGDRLFQLVVPNLCPIDKVEVVDVLSETTRGAGGFGSTGK